MDFSKANMKYSLNAFKLNVLLSKTELKKIICVINSKHMQSRIKKCNNQLYLLVCMKCIFHKELFFRINTCWGRAIYVGHLGWRLYG